MRNNLSILISGWYGCRNIGDEAILMSIVQAVKENSAHCQINVLTPFPEEVMSMHGVAAIKHPNLYSVRGAVSAVLKGHLFRLVFMAMKTDILLIGGGGLIKDSHGCANLWHTVDEVYLFKLFAKKCAFISIGVGPLSSSLGKNIIKKVSRHIDVFTVRDKSSAILIKQATGENGVDVQIAADPTFMLNAVPIANSMPDWADCLKDSVVICPRALPEFEAVSEKSSVSEILLEIICYVIDKLGKKVVLLPFCRNKNDDDMVVINRVVKVLPDELLRSHVVVADTDYKPNEVKWILGNAWCVLGMRLHAVIFSASMGVPFIGMHGDVGARPKIYDFSSEMEMRALTYDVTQHEIEKMSEKILYLEKNYNDISVTLKTKSEIMEARSFYAVKKILELKLS